VVVAAQLAPVVEATDLRARAFVHGGDADGRGRVEGSLPGLRALCCGQPIACRSTHAVVCIGGQRPPVADTRRAAQRRRRRGRVHVDTGQIREPVADDGVHVGGTRRDTLGPAGLIPAVSPDDAVGAGAGERGEQFEAVPQ
jgi:hypothetical protein